MDTTSWFLKVSGFYNVASEVIQKHKLTSAQPAAT